MLSDERFEYTLNMKTIFQGNLSKIKSYYCREDFECALYDFEHAQKDSVRFRKKELELLCKARGIEIDVLLADRTILDQIPARVQMQEDLLQSFYEMYASSPSSSDFMERIVRRLAPEYASDTVRVAILKKFVAGAGEHFKRFNVKSILEWGKNRLNKSEKALYDQAADQEKLEIILSKIEDSVFNYESVELTDVDILLLIADRIEKYKNDSSLEFEEIEISAETQDVLSECVTQYHLSEETSVSIQIQNIANAVINGMIPKEEPNISNLTGSLEKNFRMQLKTVKRISRTGKAGTADDLYKQAKKDAVKAKKGAAKKNSLDLELLGMCNDLAAGNFRVNGKTKVYLYYFALMFGMTVPLNGRECDDERNMVKNLFHDFYNDNLLRLLSEEYTDPKTAKTVEKEPTGEGINYKNFVEAIFLYFLCHDELEMMPGEKIDRVESLIEACVKRAKKAGNSKKIKNVDYTELYKTIHVNVLLNKKIEELVDYICENYLIISSDDLGKNRIMVAAEEKTASDLIEEIMEELDAAYPNIDLFEIRDENELTKEEIKSDIAFELNTFFDWKVKSLLEERYSHDEKFMRVLDAIDDRTHISNGRFHKTERERMLMLLHVLAFYSSENDSLSVFKIRSRMEKRGIFLSGSQLTNAVDGLVELGFDIQRRKDTYYLGNREYDDAVLHNLLKRVSARYYNVDEESEFMMAEALVCRLQFDKRVTRNELISIHLNHYIAQLSEKEELTTFEAVFENYKAAIDPVLEEARYQPLSRKNIFDMYVVTAIYFYLVENNGYMLSGEVEI